MKKRSSLKTFLKGENPMSTPPTPLDNPDFDALRDYVVASVNAMVRERYEDDDFSRHIYEKTLTIIYGSGYWTWRNNVDWD